MIFVIHIWISVSAPKYQRDRVQQCTRYSVTSNIDAMAENETDDDFFNLLMLKL